MHSASTRLLVFTGMVASTTLFAGIAPRVLKAPVATGQPLKTVDRIIRREEPRKALPTPLTVPTLIPNRHTKDSDNRTDGVKYIRVSHPSGTAHTIQVVQKTL